MRGALVFGLLFLLAGCGDGLSNSKAQSLIEARWREAGIPLQNLSVCSDRNADPTALCLSAASCLVPVAERAFSTVEDEHWPGHALDHVYRGFRTDDDRGRTSMIFRQFPAFRAADVRVIEVTDNVSDGLTAGQQAQGHAKIEARLIPSEFSREAAGCAGFAALVRALSQSATFDIPLYGEQVNRGGGVRIEWRMSPYYSQHRP